MHEIAKEEKTQNKIQLRNEMQKLQKKTFGRQRED